MVSLEFPIVAGGLLTDVEGVISELVTAFRVVMGIAPEPQEVSAQKASPVGHAFCNAWC